MDNRSREDRHRYLRELIRQRSLGSQEQILSLLESEGWPVTQATLSRDLRALGVIKRPDPTTGEYLYELPDQNELRSSEEALISDFRRSVLTAAGSGNLVVFKTLPGHAHAAAYALDNLEMEDVIGTLAGDDTFLAILREGLKPELWLKTLKTRIPDWEEP